MDEHNLYGIYGTLYVPWWQTTLFYWITGLIATSCVIIGLVIVWYRYKRAKNVLTPAARALLQIKELESASFATPDERSHLYSSLTVILKNYLSERYHITIRGKTDQEVLVVAAELDLPDQVKSHMNQLCNSFIEIKFAQGIALKEMVQRDLQSAQCIIKDTMPLEGEGSGN